MENYEKPNADSTFTIRPDLSYAAYKDPYPIAPNHGVGFPPRVGEEYERPEVKNGKRKK